MMPKVSTDRSPQRLVEMLSDVALREDQGWRKRLIEPPKDRVCQSAHFRIVDFSYA